MRRISLAAAFAGLAVLAGGRTASPAEPDPGPFVRSLWLVQAYGTAQALDPRNDVRTKALLAKALGKENVLTSAGVAGLMTPETFSKLAGADGTLDAAEARRALEADTPEGRKRLLPGVTVHLDD